MTRNSSMPRGGSFVAADPARGADLARYYDLDLLDHRDDIGLYLALAGRGDQSILELGCGTGRLAIPLAQAGHQVVGVDSDADMLARARASWAASGPANGGSLEVAQADIHKLDLKRTFDLVILGLNLLPLIGDRKAQTGALAVAARYVEPTMCRLVIDMTLPSAAELAAWDGTLSLAWQRPDPESGNTVAKTWSAEYDAATQVAAVTTFFENWPAAGGAVTRVARRDELHLLGANELVGLVEGAGQIGRAHV